MQSQTSHDRKKVQDTRSSNHAALHTCRMDGLSNMDFNKPVNKVWKTWSFCEHKRSVCFNLWKRGAKTKVLWLDFCWMQWMLFFFSFQQAFIGSIQLFMTGSELSWCSRMVLWELENKHSWRHLLFDQGLVWNPGYTGEIGSSGQKKLMSELEGS